MLLWPYRLAAETFWVFRWRVLESCPSSYSCVSTEGKSCKRKGVRVRAGQLSKGHCEVYMKSSLSCSWLGEQEENEGKGNGIFCPNTRFEIRVSMDLSVIRTSLLSTNLVQVLLPGYDNLLYKSSSLDYLAGTELSWAGMVCGTSN